MPELRSVLVGQLKDPFGVETMAIQVVKWMIREVSEPQLKSGFEAHVARSEEQRDHVEQVLGKMSARPGRKIYEAKRGLVGEAQHETSVADLLAQKLAEEETQDRQLTEAAPASILPAALGVKKAA